MKVFFLTGVLHPAAGRCVLGILCNGAGLLQGHGGVKPGQSITTLRDGAEEGGREMDVAQGEVLLLPPLNRCGKKDISCHSWSLDLPAERLTAASKPSGPF